MPPPHNILTSGIRGFVCKSCRSKLQLPPRAPWLSRSITSQSSSLPKSNDRKQRRLPPDAQAESPHVQEEEPIIRYFDQTPDGVRTPAKDDPEEKELLESLNHAVRELKEDVGDTMDDIEGDELGDEPPPPPDLEAEFGNPMDAKIQRLEAEIQTLESLTNKPGPISEEDRQRIRDFFFKSNLEDVSEASAESLQISTSSTTPQSLDSRINDTDYFFIRPAHYPPESRSHIFQLNKALERVKGDLDHKNFKLDERRLQAIWRYYVLCRKALLSNPKGVPPATWGTLWNYIVIPDPLNIDRMAHARRLGADMEKAGLHLQGPQLLVYIEAVFVEGNQEGAIQRWREAGAKFLGDDEYLELGARMLAENGNIEEAQKVALMIIQNSKDPSSARIFIPILQNCLAVGSNSASRAWHFYIELRTHMSSRMEMNDYDAVISLFLKAGKFDEALAAFKDMMLTNEPSISQYDSLVSKTPQRLPSIFNNKFFFGKWIKKLIGEDDLESANKVLDLMRSRQICPDAKYMNGLIGAWFRSGTSKNRQLAEDMAWSMIAKRLQVLEGREAWESLSLERPLRAAQSPNKLVYKSMVLNPSATIETFTILMKYYTQRGQEKKMLDLYTTLERAKVHPNTNFLNQLISAETPKSLRSLRSYYLKLVEAGIRPDLETFGILWLRLKQRKTRGMGSSSYYFSCRALFAEMMRWKHVLSKEIRKDGLPQDIYNLIILNFGLADDQAGTAVALRALQRVFGAYPTDLTARSIILQLTGVGSNTNARVRRLNLNKTTKERMGLVQQILGRLKQQRTEALEKMGIVYDLMSDEAKSEEALVLLSDMLHVVARKRVGDADEDGLNTTGLSQAAAKEMGVPDCAPWIVYNSIDETSLDV